MKTGPQTCSGCGQPFPPLAQAALFELTCDGCNRRTHGLLFPALYRAPETVQKQLLLNENEEASCFYHSSRKAVVPCDGCGRFLCTLCDVRLNEEHWCPNCVQEGRQQPDKMSNLETHRTLYDSMALSLSVVPVITVWGTLLSAPATLFIVFRCWNRPSSIIPRTRIRFVLAGLFALLQILAWGAGITALVSMIQ